MFSNNITNGIKITSRYNGEAGHLRWFLPNKAAMAHPYMERFGHMLYLHHPFQGMMRTSPKTIMDIQNDTILKQYILTKNHFWYLCDDYHYYININPSTLPHLVSLHHWSHFAWEKKNKPIQINNWPPVSDVWNNPLRQPAWSDLQHQ